MKRTILCLFLALPTVVPAQTNPAPRLITNHVTAVPWFREVGGTLYNTDQSREWVAFQGEAAGEAAGGLVVQMYGQEPTYQAIPQGSFVRDNTGKASAILPGEHQLVATGARKTPGKRIVLVNYPEAVKRGATIRFKAMKTGCATVEGKTLEVWDFGLPHVVTIVSTNRLQSRLAR